MTQTMPPRPTNPLLLLGLPFLAVIIAGIALYVALVRAPVQADLQAERDLLLRLTGITQPVANKLAPDFTDANNDLIADAPTDPAKLQNPDKLVFSYIINDDPESFQAGFKPFLAAFSKALGKPVDYMLFRSASEEIRALHDGRLHVCAFNTGNVPRAVNVAGFVPVAAVADAGGNPLIRSLLIARNDSPVRTLADVKGNTLTVTDAGSNSGFRAPLLMLKAAGLLPGKDYDIRYSGSHDASIEDVAAGRALIAAVASDVLAHAIAAGTISKDAYRVVAESNTFPAGTIGYAHNLTPELTQKVRDFLLSSDWKATGLDVVLGPDSVKFVPINFKDDFALVRKLDDDTGVTHSLPAAPNATPTTAPTAAN